MTEATYDWKEQRLHSLIFEGSLDAAVVLDPRGRVVLSNPAARGLRGVTLDQLFGDDAPWSAEVRAFRAEVAARGRATVEIPVKVDRAPLRKLALVGAAHGDSHAIVIRDVTERRRLEAEVNVLLSALLSFVRPAQGRYEPLELSRMVGEIRGLVERVLGPSIDFEVQLEEDLGEVLVDRARFTQVVLGVAANAREAMPRGGKVVLRAAKVALGGTAYNPTPTDPEEAPPASAGSYVVVTLIDDSGRDGGKLVDRKSLAQVKAAAAESGGCLTVHQEAGRGTTVAFYVRRIDLTPLAPPSSKLLAEPPRGTETVLLVDDDNLVRGAMRAVLEELGYLVLDAATPEQAMAHARRGGRNIHLVVADVIMPDTSGPELAKKLLELTGSRVLFTSGATAKVLAEHGFDEEDRSLLRKAFTPRALARKVREVLDRTSARRAV